IESQKVLDRQIRGTLQYMAPEVLRQDRIDSRADLYALGMTLYETVTGALPGYGKAPIDVIRMHLDEEIRRPSTINPQVPELLEQIIMKLLEKDPRHRYSSAAALLQAVAEAAGKTSPKGELLVGRGELYAAPLIGRKTELVQLMTLIAEAREGHGNGVIVAGPEGMGKSRIVRDATLRAQLDGARVFCGRCPINRKTIYAPFFDIFRQLVMAVSPDADVGEEIRRILRPVVAASGLDANSPQHGQKFRLYNRIVQSMQDMYGFLSAGSDSGGTPLVLIIEDLQWADPSTAELFTFLVGEAKHNKLVVIGTLTLAAGGETAIDAVSPMQAWEQRAREAGFPIIRVDALPEGLVREHVQSLLGEQNVSEEFVRWMQWEASGSPLNIRRIIDYLIAHHFLHWEPSGWVAEMERIRSLRIPGGAASILMEKVETLTAEQRGVLEEAAVIGGLSDVDLLTQVSDREPEETYAFLRHLIRLGLLDESSDGKTVSFPQIHLRDTLYNAMLERRRSELHQRVGEALEPTMSDGSAQYVGQIAYHFARANESTKGIRYALEAGDLATRTLAHEEAVEFYRTALELMDLNGAEEVQKSEVREKLADSYYRGSDNRAAMNAYQYLLKSFQARSRDDEPNADLARVMKKVAKVLAKRGEQDSALSYFQNALAIYEGLGQTLEVAELLNRMAGLYRDKDDFDAARASAERARLMLEPMLPNIVYGYVKNMLGLVEYASGNWQKAKAFLLEAFSIGEQVGSDQLKKVASTNLGNTLWKLGDWDTALEYFRKNLALSESEGDLWNLVTAYNNVGVIEFGRGNFHSAAEYFERSVRIDQKIGALEFEALAQENVGEALEMVGRWADAMQHYQRCLSLEGFDESRASRTSVYVPLARLTNKKGDFAKALEYGQKALAAAERARDEDLIAEASYILASIEDERENLPECEKHLTRAMAIFEQNRTIPGLARAHTAAASVALGKHRIEEAIEHAERGEQYGRSLGDRFTLA
ncbi:MAG: uncharacterized protein JWN02_592, partial [Acidobacteria bacterium]|nr:uncharacterized protein [Acidobacteriota bacterium]